MRLSTFVEFGRQVYLSPAGTPVVPAYVSSAPALLMIPAEVHEKLATGRVGELSAEHVRVLVANGVVEQSDEKRRELQAQRSLRRRAPAVRTFTLLPTSYCNMGCDYCGQKHEKGSLASNHREAIRARVVAAIESARWERVHVQWFGGEPLLAYRPLIDLATSFVAAAAGSSTAYDSQLTTNGSLLTDSKIQELVTAGVTRFDITVDGPADVHDRSRVLKNGRRNYERLMRVLREAIPRHGDVYFVLRTNVTRANLAAIPEYLEEVSSIASGRSNVFFDIAPVHEWGNAVDQLAAEQDEFDQFELTAFRLMHRLGLNFDMLPSELALTTCVATDPAAEVIDRDGRMYSCVEYPLVPQQRDLHQIGHVTDLAPLANRPEDQYSEWHRSDIEKQLPCSTCSMNPVCGGGCPKLWLDTGRGCPSFRRTVRDRIDVAAEFAGYRPLRTLDVGR